jgi:hypothetical protein
LKNDVLEILGERFSQKASDVLDDHSVRFELPNRPHDFRKHVSFIEGASVLASDGERLARRPRCQEVEFTSDVVKIQLAHIVGKQAPSLEWAESSSLIFSDRLAAVLIALDDQIVVKTGVFNAQR